MRRCYCTIRTFVPSSMVCDLNYNLNILCLERIQPIYNMVKTWIKSGEALPKYRFVERDEFKIVVSWNISTSYFLCKLLHGCYIGRFLVVEIVLFTTQ